MKTLIQKRLTTLSLLTMAMLFSIGLLVLRMKLTNTCHFQFLVWNLFLATIPYGVTTYLMSLKKTNRLTLAIAFCVWLPFLPNAPYIITDLIHLKISNTPMPWLDVLMISSFALNGLLLFHLSIRDFKIVLERHFNGTMVNITMLIVFFSTGFGIYLGRFLRYNSWEILNRSQHLLMDILNIITQPRLHYGAWLFTICFGFFLGICFLIFNRSHLNLKKL